MANTAPTIPLSITTPPQTALFTPDALAWAIDGIVLPPSLPDDTNGWPFGTEPDARLMNYLQYNQAQWNDRLSTVGFFQQRATVAAQIISSSTPTAGDTLTLTVDTFSDTYVVTTADAAAGDPYMSISAHWAQQLRTSALRNVLVGAVALSPFMLAAYKDPGTQWPVTPTLTGTGTLSGSTLSDFIGGTAGQIQTMSAPAGTEAVDTDLLHGASDPEGAGVKLQFRKGAKNGAVRAGKWTGAESDIANVGASSAAFGENTKASGAHSFAAGNGCVASGGSSVAIGGTCTASDTYAIALGNSCVASGSAALAAGDNCTASGYASQALGLQCTASGSRATAIGYGNTASHEEAIATGKDTVSTVVAGLSQSSGKFTTAGDAQTESVVVRKLVSNTAAYLDTGTGTGISLPLANSSHYLVTYEGVALYKTGAAGATGDRATFSGQIGLYVNNAGAVTRDGGFATLLAAGLYTGADLSGSGWGANAMTSSGGGSAYGLIFDVATNALKVNGVVAVMSADITAQFVVKLTYTRTHL